MSSLKIDYILEKQPLYFSLELLNCQNSIASCPLSKIKTQQNELSGSEAAVRSKKCLTCKCKDLSLTPNTHAPAPKKAECGV